MESMALEPEIPSSLQFENSTASIGAVARFDVEHTPSTQMTPADLHFDEIAGNSQALRRVLEEVEAVAAAHSTMLIYGETGTGKELIARAVHNLSPRKAGAFMKFNCAAGIDRIAGKRALRPRKRCLHGCDHSAAGTVRTRPPR